MLSGSFDIDEVSISKFNEIMMSHKSLPPSANRFLVSLETDLYVFAYDSSPLSGEFMNIFFKRKELLKKSIFVIYASKEYFTANMCLIEQKAAELKKFCSEEEINSHLYMINADNDGDIHFLLDGIWNFGTEKINVPRTEMNFNLINEGLEILKSFIEGKLRSYRGSIGVMELEALLPRIEELKSQILKDMQFYQGYNDEKTAAIVDYRIKKEAYEKLSLFGKLAAKINGKKKELSEAQYKNSYYGMAEIAMVNRQPGDIINPYQYEEYLKQQEQSTGGMKR